MRRAGPLQRLQGLEVSFRTCEATSNEGPGLLTRQSLWVKSLTEIVEGLRGYSLVILLTVATRALHQAHSIQHGKLLQSFDGSPKALLTRAASKTGPALKRAPVQWVGVQATNYASSPARRPLVHSSQQALRTQPRLPSPYTHPSTSTLLRILNTRFMTHNCLLSASSVAQSFVWLELRPFWKYSRAARHTVTSRVYILLAPLLSALPDTDRSFVFCCSDSI